MVTASAERSRAWRRARAPVVAVLALSAACSRGPDARVDPSAWDNDGTAPHPDAANQDAVHDAASGADDSSPDATRDDASSIDATGAADADAGAGTADAGLPSCAPRLIAPVSGSRAASSRPLLRWSRAAAATRLRVEVCRDRACAAVETSREVDADSLRPDADLAPGVHFWRVTDATIDATACDPTSATWQFVVGHASATAPAAGTLGLVPDFDGDGFADVAVSEGHLTGSSVDPVQPVLVYRGSRAGPSSRPDRVLGAPDASTSVFGGAFASAGDLDGDGYGELAVSTCNAAAPHYRVVVYRGSPTGLGASPWRVLYPPDGNCGAQSIAGPGDLNGDGYADLVVVAAPFSASVEPHASVFYGGPRGPADHEDAAFHVAGDRSVWLTLDAPGDVNGDGFADVALSASGAFDAMQSNREIDVYLGSAAGPVLRTPPLVALDPTLCITAAHGSADFDGDGFADLLAGLVGCGGATPVRVEVYAGGPDGVDDVGARDVTLDPTADGEGPDVASAGDLDGDGRDEAVATWYRPRSSGAAVQVLWGGPAGSTTVVEDVGIADGVQLVPAVGRDVDGDARSDVLVGGTTRARPDGALFYLRGRASSGFPAAPDAVLQSVASPANNFGTLLARSASHRAARSAAAAPDLARSPDVCAQRLRAPWS